MSVKYFNDADLGYFVSIIKGELAKYVLAVQGKDLSTNDFTDALLTKLNGIEASADVNILEGIIINNIEQTIDANKKITLGTAAGMNVTDTYSAQGTAPVSGIAVAQAIATVTGISFESYNSYAELPVTGQVGVIYLVPNSGSAPNVKDEYFWNATTSAYELFGTTQIDLTNYVQFTDLVAMTQAEVEAVWNATT